MTDACARGRPAGLAGRTDGQTDGGADKRTNGRDRQTDEQTCGQADGRTVGRSVSRSVGRSVGRSDDARVGGCACACVWAGWRMRACHTGTHSSVRRRRARSSHSRTTRRGCTSARYRASRSGGTLPAAIGPRKKTTPLKKNLSSSLNKVMGRKTGSRRCSLTRIGWPSTCCPRCSRSTQRAGTRFLDRCGHEPSGRPNVSANSEVDVCRVPAYVHRSAAAGAGARGLGRLRE